MRASSSTNRTTARRVGAAAPAAGAASAVSTASRPCVAGSQSSAVVPRPIVLSSRSVPSSCCARPVDHGEPEARSLAHALRREERLDGLRHRLRVHAGARVGDAQEHVAVAGKLLRSRVGGPHRADRQAPAIGHRVARVQDEVEKRQLELVAVDERHRQAVGQLDPHLDRRPDGLLQKRHHAAHEGADVGRRDVQLLPAGEGEQALGQRGAAAGALQRPVDQPRRLRIAVEVPAQEVEVAEHGHQQVVEVVGDPAGQLPHRLHLLGLAELDLRALALPAFLENRLVRLRQLGRPLRHAPFQRLVERAQVLLEGLLLRDLARHADEARPLAGSVTTRARISIQWTLWSGHTTRHSTAQSSPVSALCSTAPRTAGRSSAGRSP